MKHIPLVAAAPPAARALIVAVAMMSLPLARADLKDGLVAYWPLDQIVGAKTPDLVSSYDMELANLTVSDLVDGKVGKAFKFDNARQTMLRRINAPGEQLPINQHPALTIAFWANVTGMGLSDLRLFAEGSTTDNNPLFNLGTANNGSTGQLDFYLRQTGWTTVDHLKSDGEPLDGTWHHLAFIQQADGSRALYVDGVRDTVEIPAKAEGAWRVNTTTIGGILRANPTHWLTGMMDEVVLWSRALSEPELTQLVQQGMTSVFPPLAQGMVAYWPLDEVVGVKTPDLVNGYDMELANLTAADLVTGKIGKAFKFENARQTMLRRIHNPGEQLPINQYAALTISFWANVMGTGLSDLRLFSEASTTDNNPLFNLGTANNGATGQLDFYLRQTGWTTVDHLKSDGEPLDGTWHHLAFVQQTDGTRALYVDGAKDTVEIPAKAEGAWRVNTTTIGGILRANPTHWLTGLMDDVALWNRALSEDEIKSVVTNGTPVPFSKPQPLAIRSFRSNLPAVAVGDMVTLRWDVTKNVQVEIDQGVGDVTAKTVSGLGSTEVTLNTSKTFTLTLKRGAETVSQSLTVAAIAGIAPGWTLIDNFDRYSTGLLSGNGGWFDLDANDVSIVELDGNRFLAANRGESIAVLNLGPLTVAEGQQRTLFFRAYLVGDELEPVRGQVALTDRPVRFGNEGGGDIGPGAIISDEPGLGRQVGGYNGFQNPVELFDPALQTATAYNVWVDINNGPFTKDVTVDPPVAIDTGDHYSIHIQKNGESQRVTLLTDYLAARNPIGQADTGFTTPHLDKLIVATLAGHSTITNLFIDDIYLSKAGLNTTVPRAFGFTVPVPSEPPALTIKVAGAEVEIGWNAGVLESAPSVTGPWEAVPNATNPPYKTTPQGTRFYRTRN